MGEVLATRKILKALTINEVGPAEARGRGIVPSFVRAVRQTTARRRRPAGAIDGRRGTMSAVSQMVSSTARPISRNWSLPNILTYARVAAVPLVGGLLVWPDEPWAPWTALAIFIAAGI